MNVSPNRSGGRCHKFATTAKEWMWQRFASAALAGKSRYGGTATWWWSTEPCHQGRCSCLGGRDGIGDGARCVPRPHAGRAHHLTATCSRATGARSPCTRKNEGCRVQRSYINTGTFGACSATRLWEPTNPCYRQAESIGFREAQPMDDAFHWHGIEVPGQTGKPAASPAWAIGCKPRQDRTVISSWDRRQG